MMQQLPDSNSHKIALLIGEQAQCETLLDFTAILALRGPVCILDAGNRFDPYRVTRAIRRQTAQLDQVFVNLPEDLLEVGTVLPIRGSPGGERAAVHRFDSQGFHHR